MEVFKEEQKQEMEMQPPEDEKQQNDVVINESSIFTLMRNSGAMQEAMQQIAVEKNAELATSNHVPEEE